MSTSDRRTTDRREGVRRNSDRRRPRLAVPGFSVRILKAGIDGQSLIDGRLIDISLTGIQLAVSPSAAFAIDDVLLVDVRLEDGCLNLSAKVARTRLEAGSQIIGCRLASPPPPEKLAILRRLTKTDPRR